MIQSSRHNLISEICLPVRLRNGRIRRIRPAEITADLGTDREAVAPAWPRTDFNIASYEFWIGLLFAASPAADNRAWAERWNAPPSVAELDAAFARYAAAFNVDGGGPRFMQDFEPLDGDETPIERLLIDAPGGNAVKQNKDVLAHRDRYQALGPAAAAMALYTLHQFAPSGGKGNRTSMRGGGPLTVLALPRRPDGEEPSLWERIWANTPLNPDGPVRVDEMARAFPWMASTLASVDDRKVLPEIDAHPAQAFFGMPRRIRLFFDDAEGVCDLTGEPARRRAVGWVQRPYGVQYEKWVHPLTPYYRQKEGTELLPVLAKPGRVGYRGWRAATIHLERRSPLSRGAASIETFKLQRAAEIGAAAEHGALLAGWAMSNMEALDYVCAEQPLHLGPHQEALDELALQMTAAGEEAAKALRGALRAAVFGAGSKVEAGAVMFDEARRAFFENTQDEFHRILDHAAEQDRQDLFAPDADAPRQQWRRALAGEALAVFDVRVLPLVEADPVKAGARGADARARLYWTLRGGPKFAPLHDALDLSRPNKTKAEESV